MVVAQAHPLRTTETSAAEAVAALPIAVAFAVAMAPVIAIPLDAARA